MNSPVSQVMAWIKRKASGLLCVEAESNASAQHQIAMRAD